MKYVFSLTLTALMLALIGCGGAETPTPADPAEVPEADDTIDLGDPGPPPPGQTDPPIEDETDITGAEPANGDVSLIETDWSGVEKLVESHKGRIVVLDLWATSCPPCRKEFPGLVQINRELGDQVACISVSLDYDGIPSRPVDSYRQPVLEFLKSQNATFTNVLCTTDSETVFNTLKLGSIPAVYVYDQTGKLAHRFADPEDGVEHTYAHDIRPFVDSLLASN